MSSPLLGELCVEVLCRMELSHDSFQVFEKYPGIYLFLVHPNEVVSSFFCSAEFQWILALCTMLILKGLSAVFA